MLYRFIICLASLMFCLQAAAQDIKHDPKLLCTPDPADHFRFSKHQFDSIVFVLENGSLEQKRKAVNSIDGALVYKAFNFKEEALPHLIKLLKTTPIEEPSSENHNRPLHSEIAHCLGMIDDDRSRDALLELCNDGKEDKETKRWALLSLGWLKDARIEKAAMDALRDGDWELKGFSIATLGNIRSKEGAGLILATLKEVLSYKTYPRELIGRQVDPPLYRSIILSSAIALAEIGDLAIDDMFNALKDDNVIYRNWVAYSIARTKNPKYVEKVGPFLIEVLQTSDDWWLHEQVIWCMGDLKYQDAIPTLINMIKNRSLRRSPAVGICENLKKLGVNIERVCWEDKKGYWHAKYVLIDEKGKRTEIPE